jgi:hypothetical protein
MAVAASNVTLVDFGTHDLPRLTRREPGDFTSLGGAIAVIEFKDHGIRLAAIDAMVCEEVLIDQSAILDPVCVDSGNLARDVDLAVV